MIRPFTCLCAILAAISGLYLYQTKQRTLTLDRQIDAVIAEAQRTAARIGVLKADYADLSRPDRLMTLSQRFLDLRPTTPGQFVAMNDLDQKLPPPGAPPSGAPQSAVIQVSAATPLPVPAGPAAARNGDEQVPPAHDAGKQAAGAAPAPRHPPVLLVAAHAAPHAPPHPAPAAAEAARFQGAVAPTPISLTRPSQLRSPPRPAPISAALRTEAAHAGSMLGDAAALSMPAPVPAD
jgi:hypothetical protein